MVENVLETYFKNLSSNSHNLPLSRGSLNQGIPVVLSGAYALILISRIPIIFLLVWFQNDSIVIYTVNVLNKGYNYY